MQEKETACQLAIPKDGLKHSTYRTGWLEAKYWGSAQDRQGNIWVGTQGNGVMRYNGGNRQNFTTTDGLSNNQVVEILEDRDGILWFGTDGGGITRYDPLAKSKKDAWITFTTEGGLPCNSVWSIYQDQQGNLWFGTGGLFEPGCCTKYLDEHG